MPHLTDEVAGYKEAAIAWGCSCQTWGWARPFCSPALPPPGTRLHACFCSNSAQSRRTKHSWPSLLGNKEELECKERWKLFHLQSHWDVPGQSLRSSCLACDTLGPFHPWFLAFASHLLLHHPFWRRRKVTSQTPGVTYTLISYTASEK